MKDVFKVTVEFTVSAPEELTEPLIRFATLFVNEMSKPDPKEEE